MQKIVSVAVATCLFASPVLAEQRVNFEAVPTDGGTIRFVQGIATVDLPREHGAVQVTPLGLDHGRLTFAVAVLNKGPSADNFGIEDIRASIGGQDVPVLSRERLDQMARNRALWTQIAIAALAGAAAGVAASQHDTYRATTFTRHGTYRTIVRMPSAAGQIAAAGSVAAGAYGISQVQQQLDATRAGLADEIVQTTTIEPEDSYGGRIVVEKPHGQATWPQEVQLVVTFNGEAYPFTFRVSRAR
jgi:hypothetical protein